VSYYWWLFWRGQKRRAGGEVCGALLELVLWHWWAISSVGFGSGGVYFWDLEVVGALDGPLDVGYHLMLC